MDKTKSTKAQKDVQEILLSGSKDERNTLFDSLEENKNLSILEKKVYGCLIKFKYKEYEKAKDLIEELIFDIGGLQESQQAKVYLLKAQIYEKLQDTENKYEKEIQESLDKCYQIFRNKRFNKIQYDAHHYLLQIADMQIRQKQNEEAEQIYALIFKQEYYRYPNDWAILIEAYLRYFDSRLKRRCIVDEQKFEKCVKLMKDKYLDKNNLHKVYFYQGVDCLLREQNNKQKFVDFLKQSEESYKIKNKIKKNKKMINFVEQFITVDNCPGGIIIQMIPIFLKLGEQFKEIVKNRLILLHQKQKEWENQRLEDEVEHNEKRNDLLNEIYQNYKNKTIESYLEQQKEIQEKITILKDNRKLEEEKQQQQQKLTLTQQKDYQLKLNEINQSILKENENLQKIVKEKQEFVQKLQLNQEAFQPKEFEIYKIFEEQKNIELDQYASKSGNEQKNFERKFTLNLQLQQIIDLSKNIRDINQEQSMIEIKQINSNQEDNHNQEINQDNNLENNQDDQIQIIQINLCCCFELIQLEEFGFAQQILKKILFQKNKFQNIQALLSLLLFSNIPYDEGTTIIYDWMMFNKMNQDIQVPQIQNQLRAIIQYQSQMKLPIGKQDIQLIIQTICKCVQNSEKMISTDKLRRYSRDEHGCLYYLIEDIKAFRFYDPHIFEFKNIIYDLLYQIKSKNSQAILFDGSTYAGILDKNKNSWKLKE